MTATLSDAWLDVFPAPRIPEVLTYLSETWTWLRNSFAEAVDFSHDEPTLTDNLCEALANRDRRFAHRMDCDFQSETWELRRAADGTTSRLARADIRVILGAPGTPHLVMEFKKLDGSTGARRRYCFDGISRFVEGKYAVGHAYGIMCGFSTNALDAEAASLSQYISLPANARRLACLANQSGDVVTAPSIADPIRASFDTAHARATAAPPNPITLLHLLIACSASG